MINSIEYSRGQAKKAKLYRDLLQVTRQSLAYLDQIETDLKGFAVDPMLLAGWSGRVQAPCTVTPWAWMRAISFR